MLFRSVSQSRYQRWFYVFPIQRDDFKPRFGIDVVVDMCSIFCITTESMFRGKYAGNVDAKRFERINEVGVAYA